jgi:hypothetical protein
MVGRFLDRNHYGCFLFRGLVSEKVGLAQEGGIKQKRSSG